MDYDKKIIKMLDGELSEGELEQLRETLDDNPELAQNRELYEKVIKAISLHGKKRLRNELDDYLGEHLAGGSGGMSVTYRRKTWIYSGIAATLVLGAFYIGLMDDSMQERGTIQLKRDAAPVHADSASMEPDSTQHQHDLKKNVD